MPPRKNPDINELAFSIVAQATKERPKPLAKRPTVTRSVATKATKKSAGLRRAAARRRTGLGVKTTGLPAKRRSK